jgi:hypothetical protein
MNKRRAALAVVLMMAAAQSFAMKDKRDLGLGLEVTSIDLDAFGAALSAHLPGIPLFIGIGGDFYNEPGGEPDLSATVDYWLLHSSRGFLNLYLGLGLYGAMTPDLSWYAAGLRLPIGLQVWPMNTEELEMFLEAAPVWVPVGSAGRDWDAFEAQLALGFRYWFDR